MWLSGALLALVGLAAIALWLYSTHQTRQSLEAVATLHAREIDSQLVRLAELPTVLSGDPRLRDALLSPARAQIDTANAVLNRVRQQTGIEHAFLMDESGYTIASSNHVDATSFIGKNYAFRSYFKEAMSGRRGTSYAVGATTGEPGYFVSQPVTDRARILGVLVFKLSLHPLTAIWSVHGEDIVLIDDVGVVILANNPEMLYLSTAPLSDTEAERLRQVRHYPVNALKRADIEWRRSDASWRGQDYLTASKGLQTEAWRVGVMLPVQGVLTTFAGYFLGLMAVLCITVLLVRDWWRQRRLASLEQHNARQLAAQVTEKTQALEHAQRTLIENSNLTALGRMSSAINHEVNQPLASLHLNLASLRQLVRSDTVDHTELQTTIEDCERTTRRISDVVAALRTLARPGDTRFKPIVVGALIESAIETLVREKSSIVERLRSELGSPDAVFQGNPVLLQQALLNLLHNAETAVRHLAEPEIWIRSETVDAEVHILVSDNGPGVGADLKDAPFEPFLQGKDSMRGLGLGLALARQIAFYHHGRLSHERLSDNTTRFTLSLPLEAASES